MDKFIAGATILATLGMSLMARHNRLILRRIGVAGTLMASVAAVCLIMWGLIETFGPKITTPYAYLQLGCQRGARSASIAPDNEFFLDVKSGLFYSLPGHAYGVRLASTSYADCSLSNSGDLSAMNLRIPFSFIAHHRAWLHSHDLKGVGFVSIQAVNHGAIVRFRIIDDWSKIEIVIAPAQDVTCTVPPDFGTSPCPVPFNFQSMAPIDLIPLSPSQKFGVSN